MTTYALDHFATEEAYMIKFNYPDYKQYKKEHSDFASKTIEYCKQVTDGNNQLANDILGFLIWWLTNRYKIRRLFQKE